MNFIKIILIMKLKKQIKLIIYNLNHFNHCMILQLKNSKIILKNHNNVKILMNFNPSKI